MDMATEPEAFPLVAVTWRDSCTVDQWTPLRGADFEPVRCFTVGSIVRETEEFIAIAGSTASGVEGGQACQIMCIPKSAIIARTVIEEA
jgi:hypothetical protein